MKLSREDVLHLAQLARLQMNEEELARAQQELTSILGYVDRLAQVDTTDVPPASADPVTSWREDVAMPVDEAVRQRILSAFPERRGDLLQTPGVFEKPKG